MHNRYNLEIVPFVHLLLLAFYLGKSSKVNIGDVYKVHRIFWPPKRDHIRDRSHSNYLLGANRRELKECTIVTT